MMSLDTAQRYGEPRLEPIEHPDSLKMKLAYWLTERMLGTVITPLKVHHARFPEALGLARKLAELDGKFSIDPKLKHLIKVYVSVLNGCAFCVDIAKTSAKKSKLPPDVFDDLLQFEESDRFTEAEKAALAYVGEATRNKHVADATFERLRPHFSEREIVQITLANAIENFYNLMNTPMNIGSDELCELWN